MTFVAEPLWRRGSSRWKWLYRWLDTGQRERSFFAVYLGFWDRPFAVHRQEPHFLQILNQMGIQPLTFGSRPGS